MGVGSHGRTSVSLIWLICLEQTLVCATCHLSSADTGSIFGESCLCRELVTTPPFLLVVSLLASQGRLQLFSTMFSIHFCRLPFSSLYKMLFKGNFVVSESGLRSVALKQDMPVWCELSGSPLGRDLHAIDLDSSSYDVLIAMAGPSVSVVLGISLLVARPGFSGLLVSASRHRVVPPDHRHGPPSSFLPSPQKPALLKGRTIS